MQMLGNLGGKRNLYFIFSAPTPSPPLFKKLSCAIEVTSGRLTRRPEKDHFSLSLLDEQNFLIKS